MTRFSKGVSNKATKKYIHQIHIHKYITNIKIQQKKITVSLNIDEFFFCCYSEFIFYIFVYMGFFFYFVLQNEIKNRLQDTKAQRNVNGLNKFIRCWGIESYGAACQIFIMVTNLDELKFN